MQWVKEPRVLSVQSHVVHGNVGNKAATFPMQLHGVEVDPLNVVHFSNHTGYKVFKGTRMSAEEFSSIVEGLTTNGFLPTYSCVLSGYVGNEAVLKELAKLVGKWQDERRKALAEYGGFEDPSRPVYVCDPVCGDNGKLYVSESVLPVYRDQLIPLADIVTPNGFEASVLSGIEVKDIASAKKAAQWFHDRGVSRVVIKSFDDVASHPDGKTISLITSEIAATTGESSTPSVHRIEIAKLATTLSGTGDAFAALVIGHLTSLYAAKKPTPTTVEVASAADGRSLFVQAVERAVASIHGILSRTMSMLEVSAEKGSPLTVVKPESAPNSAHGGKPVQELAIVKNASMVLDPPMEGFTAAQV